MMTQRDRFAAAIAKRFPGILKEYSQFTIVDFVFDFFRLEAKRRANSQLSSDPVHDASRSASSNAGPTAVQRAASLAVAKILARTIMDTLVIDGRPIGQWTISEARQYGHRKTWEGYLLLAISRPPHLAGTELVSQVVSVDEIQRVYQTSIGVADAA